MTLHTTPMTALLQGINALNVRKPLPPCMIMFFPVGRASRLPEDVQRIAEEDGFNAKDDDVDCGRRRRFEAAAGYSQLRAAAERRLRCDDADGRRVDTARRSSQQRGAGREVRQRLRRRLLVGRNGGHRALLNRKSKKAFCAATFENFDLRRFSRSPKFRRIKKNFFVQKKHF